MRIPLLAFSLAGLSACVPNIEDAPEQAAAAYCERAAECGWLSEDEVSACAVNNQDIFENLWTEVTCEDGFDRDSWSHCIDVLEKVDCGDTIALGWGDINDGCNSDAVCL